MLCKCGCKKYTQESKEFLLGHKKKRKAKEKTSKKSKPQPHTFSNWIRDHYPTPDQCDINPDHKTETYYWTNRTGNYTRNVRDWMMICHHCKTKKARMRLLEYNAKVRKDKIPVPVDNPDDYLE